TPGSKTPRRQDLRAHSAGPPRVGVGADPSRRPPPGGQRRGMTYLSFNDSVNANMDFTTEDAGESEEALQKDRASAAVHLVCLGADHAVQRWQEWPVLRRDP
ncbi:unnamed protein product, partial [Prorocentrum cordatum]